MTPSAWSLAVVVPARNEHRTIAATVRSILRASQRAATSPHRPESVTICIVADACSDRTAQTAVEALRGHSHSIVTETDLRSAGAARALGSTLAVGRHGDTSRLWIANTDADTVVPPDWLLRHLEHAADGIGCVTGVVDLPSTDRRMRRAFRRDYRRGISQEGHRHVHGANLGIRADVLMRIGNWPDVLTGEDQLLWDRAGAVGVFRRADPSLVVQTSDRVIGRAPDGFAADLARLSSSSVASFW